MGYQRSMRPRRIRLPSMGNTGLGLVSAICRLDRAGRGVKSSVVEHGSLKMAKYDDIVESYRDKQAGLRRQIAKLKGQVKMGTAETGTAAAIQRIQRQVIDLDEAVARCREKTKGRR